MDPPSLYAHALLGSATSRVWACESSLANQKESCEHSLVLVLVYSLVDTGVKMEPLRAKCELTGVSPNLCANIFSTRITNGDGPIERGLANSEES